MGATIQPSSYGVPAIILARSAARALADPTKYSWEWRNQGVASVTARNSAIVISSPAEAADNWHFLAKPVPPKPYNVIFHILPTLVAVNYMGAGVGWLQTSNTNFALADQRLGTPTFDSGHGTGWTITANYSSSAGPITLVQWIKLTDDATNRRVYLSPDGKDGNWSLYHTVATNTDVTPDRIIFGVEARNATYAVSLTVDSYEEHVG